MASAYFVYRPRTSDELTVPHLLNDERKYKIAKEVVLPRIDYENFITDMLVARDFLEDDAPLCSWRPEAKCLLIRRQSDTEGILTVPDKRGFVLWAAAAGSSGG